MWNHFVNHTNGGGSILMVWINNRETHSSNTGLTSLIKRHFSEKHSLKRELRIINSELGFRHLGSKLSPANNSLYQHKQSNFTFHLKFHLKRSKSWTGCSINIITALISLYEMSKYSKDSFNPITTTRSTIWSASQRCRGNRKF